jgi:hypothetical protein
MGIGVHKIIEQMKKTNTKNHAKIVTLEKWLTMTPNWRHYGHPPVAPPNLGANWTLFQHHEPETHHKSFHQIDED